MEVVGERKVLRLVDSTVTMQYRGMWLVVGYLDFDVAHFGGGADDGPSHQRREDVLREVGACIAAFDKLVEEWLRKKERKTEKMKESDKRLFTHY